MNLNKALGVQFKLNLPIIPTQNTANEFPTSKYSDGEELSCVLVRNKHEGKILFKPYQIADYILFMTEIDNSGFRQTIESGLKNCQSVQTILPIDLNKIKNHSKLVVF